jgi:hypothetical protein
MTGNEPTARLPLGLTKKEYKYKCDERVARGKAAFAKWKRRDARGAPRPATVILTGDDSNDSKIVMRIPKEWQSTTVIR